MKVSMFKSTKIFAANSYIIEKDNHAILINNGFLSDELICSLQKYKCIDGLILTHKHFDHIRMLKRTKELFPNIKIYSHLDDYQFLSNPVLNCSYFMTPEDLVMIKDLDVINLTEGSITIGEFEFELFYCPGHSSDSIVIKTDDNFFVGDLLFHRGVGRTDLPTSDSLELKKSINRIIPLLKSQNFNIFFGHDDPLKSEELLSINPYLKSARRIIMNDI